MRHGEMQKLADGNGNKDYNKPGLTANIPAWAKKVTESKTAAIILETAHPAKFGATVVKAIGREPSIPDRLEKVLSLPDNAIPMEKEKHIIMEPHLQPRLQRYFLKN